MILFLFIALSWGSINVPLIAVPNSSRYSLQMTLDNLPELSPNFIPFLGSETVIYREVGTNGQVLRDSLIGTWARLSQALIVIHNLASIRLVRGVESYVNLVAFGPGSDLVGQYGSVDFVRDGLQSRLILSSSEQSFLRDHCLPESGFGLRPRVIGSAMTFDGSYLSAHRSIWFTSNGKVLVLPDQDFENTFRDTGLLSRMNRRSPYNLTIDNCSTVWGSFPEISVSFSPSGRLVFYPSDYVLMMDNDVCQLLIQVREGNDIIQVNPLAVPGINVRTTNEEIIFCDSQIL